MSLESDMGKVTNDVVSAVNDSLASSLATVLKNEMKLTDDQIRRVIAIATMTVEGVAYNGVNQYVAVANKHVSTNRNHGTIDVDTTVKKTSLFGR